MMAHWRLVMYEDVKIYEVHYRRYYNTRTDFTLIGQAYTVAEAKKLRCVSGDLVINAVTGEVVKNKVWLFGWEIKDPNCYAQKAIRDSIGG